MEQQILNESEIYKRIKSDFLFIPLTVDDRALLPEDKHIPLSGDCKFLGSKKKIRRIADVNVNLQVFLLKAGSQPYFMHLMRIQN